MAVCPFVYLDGVFQPADEARISIFDRGLLFAQSAYEVTAVVGGRLIDADAHMTRLTRTLAGIDIPATWDADVLLAIHRELVRRNDLEEGGVYLQITGGEYGDRDFAGPDILSPRLFLFAQPRAVVDDRARDGISAITLEDTRWARRDYKTTQLLSQALAYRQARSAGCETAIMHESGMVTEAASANLWMVEGSGALLTRDISPAILGGITRAALLGLVNVPVREEAFSIDALKGAAEVLQTSSGAMVLPVTHIDGEPVGDGRPGPVTRALQKAYFEHIGIDLAVRTPWLVM